MSIIWADPGGEYYFGLGSMTAAVTAGVWSENNGYNLNNGAPSGRQAATNGLVYAISSGSGNAACGKYFAASYGHMIAGNAIYSPSLVFASGINSIILAYTNGTILGVGTQCDVRVTDSAGHLAVTRNGTILGSISTAVLTTGWNYVELDVTFATGATGTADVYLNNTLVIHATSVQTATTVATANRVYYGMVVNSSFMKDMYCLDAATSPNILPFGDCTVQPKYSSGAGVNSQFTPNVGPFTLTSVNTTGVYQGTITGGASNNYAGQKVTITGFVNGANNQTNVTITANSATSITVGGTTITETHAGSAAMVCLVGDGIAHLGTWPDGDTTYVADATSGHISDFAHEALAAPTTLFGIVHASYLRKDDAGARNGNQVCLSTGTTETSATFALTNSYLYYYDFLDQDPHTTAAWTAAGYNAATFGAKVT